eukprot:4323800-Pleurochrysis_carterae.AAC.1
MTSPPATPTTPPVPYTAPPAAPTTENEHMDLDENTMLNDLSAPSPPQDHADSQGPQDGSVDADGEGTIADRILRRRRQTAAVVATDLLSEPTSPFVLYLCSGVQRDGDLAAHLTNGGMAVVHVDYERGGIGHDLSRDDVADRVAALAANTLCVAVVASPPCST